MKKFASIAFTCLLPTLASAADISNSSPWEGFYAGVNAGYAWDNSDISLSGNMATIASGASASNDDNSALGGIQIGYNFPVGSAILGIEADISYLAGLHPDCECLHGPSHDVRFTGQR